jgi:flagellar biosynthesis GTPase FlhF
MPIPAQETTMRIERFDAIDARNGMREINAKYGDDVLIISNSRLAGKNRFVIAVNIASAPTPDADPVIVRGDSADAAAINALTLLMTTRFESLQRDLEQVRLNQESLFLLTQDENANAAASEHKVMKLLANSTLPVNLLLRLQKITARCTQDTEIIQAVRIFLRRQLPGSVVLADTPTTHILVGTAGVGKTLSAIRMGATLNSSINKSAVVVGYKLSQDGAQAQLQKLGEKAGVPVDYANDPAALLNIINRHIGTSSVIVDVPGNLPTSELANLKKCLPSAMFHLVMAKDNNQQELQFFTTTSGLTLSSAIITRLDCKGGYWPLIHSLMEHKIPLLFGAHSADACHPFVSLDKKMIIEQAIRSMMTNSARVHTKHANIVAPAREQRFPFKQAQV